MVGERLCGHLDSPLDSELHTPASVAETICVGPSEARCKIPRSPLSADARQQPDFVI